MSMGPEQLAYLAGLLEGEGCFSIRRRAGRAPVPEVRLQMQDRDVVDRVAAWLEASVYELVARGNQSRPSYVTRVDGTLALVLMKALKPMMGERRTAKIEEIMADF